MSNWRNLQWFIDRIGKRIYRKPIESCSCSECQRNYVDIWDGIPKTEKSIGCHREFHARYLYDCQNDMQIEYFDYPL